MREIFANDLRYATCSTSCAAVAWLPEDRPHYLRVIATPSPKN